MMRAGVFLVVAALAAASCSEHNREAVESNNQGMALLRANRYSDAREKFQRAAEEDRHYDTPLYNLALSYIRQRNWSAAADALQRAIARNGNNPEYHFRLGDAHYHIATSAEGEASGQGGAHFEQARTAFQAAVQRNRSMYYAHLRLAQIAEALDDPQTAMREYTETITLAPRAYVAYWRLARLYTINNFHDLAAQAAAEGLRIAPEGVPERGQMHFYRGVALQHDANQRLVAAEEFLAAQREDPQIVEAFYNAGTIYAEMPDRHPQAILYLNQFVSARGGGAPRDYLDNAQNRLQELQSAPQQQAAPTPAPTPH
jgi:tetratricopeptide (TPR) repeat protein